MSFAPSALVPLRAEGDVPRDAFPSNDWVPPSEVSHRDLYMDRTAMDRSGTAAPHVSRLFEILEWLDGDHSDFVVRIRSKPYEIPLVTVTTKVYTRANAPAWVPLREGEDSYTHQSTWHEIPAANAQVMLRRTMTLPSYVEKKLRESFVQLAEKADRFHFGNWESDFDRHLEELKERHIYEDDRILQYLFPEIFYLSVDEHLPLPPRNEFLVECSSTYRWRCREAARQAIFLQDENGNTILHRYFEDHYMLYTVPIHEPKSFMELYAYEKTHERALPPSPIIYSLENDYFKFLSDGSLRVASDITNEGMEFLEVLAVENNRGHAPMDYLEHIPYAPDGQGITGYRFLPYASAALTQFFLCHSEYLSADGTLCEKPVENLSKLECPTDRDTESKIRWKGMEVVKKLILRPLRVNGAVTHLQVLFDEMAYSLRLLNDGWLEMATNFDRDLWDFVSFGFLNLSDSTERLPMAYTRWRQKPGTEGTEMAHFDYATSLSPLKVCSILFTCRELAGDAAIGNVLFPSHVPAGETCLGQLLEQMMRLPEEPLQWDEPGGEPHVVERRRKFGEYSHYDTFPAVASLARIFLENRLFAMGQVQNLLLTTVEPNGRRRHFLRKALDCAKSFVAINEEEGLKLREELSLALLDFITASNRKKIAIAPEFSQLATTYDFGSGLTPFAIGDGKRSGLLGANWDWSRAVKDLPLTDPVRRKFCQKHSIQTFTWDKEGDRGRPK